MGSLQREFQQAVKAKHKRERKLLEERLARLKEQETLNRQVNVNASKRAAKAADRKQTFVESQANAKTKERRDAILKDQEIYNNLKNGSMSIDDAYMGLSATGQAALNSAIGGGSRRGSSRSGTSGGGLSNSDVIGINKALMSSYQGSEAELNGDSFGDYQKENYPNMVAGLNLGQGVSPRSAFSKRLENLRKKKVESDAYDNTQYNQIWNPRSELKGGGLGFTNKGGEPSYQSWIKPGQSTPGQSTPGQSNFLTNTYNNAVNGNDLVPNVQSPDIQAPPSIQPLSTAQAPKPRRKKKKNTDRYIGNVNVSSSDLVDTESFKRYGRAASDIYHNWMIPEAQALNKTYLNPFANLGKRYFGSQKRVRKNFFQNANR